MKTRSPFLLPVLVLFWAALPVGAIARQSDTETVPVAARVETETRGSGKADTADDVAIWRNPRDPARSLIIGTDKKNGLHVYGLDGKIRFHVLAGKVNNVDLREGVLVGGQRNTIVAVSDANDEHAAIALFRLDAELEQLVPIGRVPGGTGRAYGLCLYQQNGKLWAFNVFRNGAVVQVALAFSNGGAQASVVRQLKLGSNAEGCVVDDRTGMLYVAERDVGIWRFEADAEGSTKPSVVAATDKRRLVADVEGLALAVHGTDGGYLLASSQGSDAYAVYRLPEGNYAGSFRLVEGLVDGTSQTDGIELVLGDFGAGFPGGLFVAQDDDNGSAPQNFKLVAWEDISRALLLKPR